MRLAAAVVVLAGLAACTAKRAEPPPSAPPAVRVAPALAVDAGASRPAEPELVFEARDVDGSYPAHVLGGTEGLRPIGTDGGERVVALGPIYLLGALSHAREPVYVHLEGVRAEPDTEVDLYLMNPSRGTLNDTIDPASYLGTLRAPAGTPTALPIVTFEVRDGAAPDGGALRPRSILREMAGLGFALVARRGSATIDHLVLTTAPQAAWLKQEKRAR